MPLERDNPEFRKIVNTILQPLFERSTFQGIYGGQGALQSLGLSKEEAEEIVYEFNYVFQLNAKPGNVLSIPEFDPEIPPTDEQKQDETLLGLVWFTLGYIEDATERNNHNIGIIGRQWLGNSTEDTKKLIDHFQEDPNRTIGFLNWAFGRSESLQSMFEEYRTRSATHTLRPPEFEE